MQESGNDSELRLKVISTKGDGRRRYDPHSKEALAKACLEPGVSLAGMALQHGVNANLLRKWVASYQLTRDFASPTVMKADSVDAFVPVMMGGGNAARIDKRRLMPPMVPAPEGTPPARLRAQLPNGATLEFECTGRDAELVSKIIETLGCCDVSSGR